jgi:hypothetical protein
MTMPHLMNCPHSPDGWCLDCVKSVHDAAEDLRTHSRNTATGRVLGRALNELEELKNLNEGNQNENRTDRNSDPLPSSDR